MSTIPYYSISSAGVDIPVVAPMTLTGLLEEFKKEAMRRTVDTPPESAYLSKKAACKSGKISGVQCSGSCINERLCYCG